MDENKTFFRKAGQNKLGFRDIFRDVFRRHTAEENARLFLAGTALTTPDEVSMLSKWLRPYMFARIFLVGVFLIIAAFMMNNSLTLPFIFVAGSFLVPITEMFFFWEMNIPRNISFPTVLLILFAGGILSLLFTTLLNGLRGSESLIIWAIATGLTEESGKVLALMLWLRGKDKKHILTGMLVGAAVGAGFAAVESAGYAVITGWSPVILILRAILAPGGHVTWAAIMGGGLIWAKGKEKLSVKHLFNPIFLFCFVFSVATHAAWDYVSGIPDLVLFIFVLEAVIILTAYKIMKKGLAQIVNIAVEQNGDRLTLALNHDFFQNLLGTDLRDLAGAEAAAGVPSKSGQDTGPRLMGISGTFRGRCFAVGNSIRIGRDPGSCELVFPFQTAGVSRKHCKITFLNGYIGIQDTGSSNGTFVNGYRLNPGQFYELFSGDHICLGSAREEFQVILT